MISTQLLKGVLDSCILKIISEEETYGYLIVEKLNKIGFSEVKEGTVYPILLRLEKNNLVESERKKSEIGPIRKYLKITDDGIKEVEKFNKEWDLLVELVNKIMK